MNTKTKYLLATLGMIVFSGLLAYVNPMHTNMWSFYLAYWSIAFSFAGVGMLGWLSWLFITED